MAALQDIPSSKRWLPLEANPDVMNQVFLLIVFLCWMQRTRLGKNKKVVLNLTHSTRSLRSAIFIYLFIFARRSWIRKETSGGFSEILGWKNEVNISILPVYGFKD